MSVFCNRPLREGLIVSVFDVGLAAVYKELCTEEMSDWYCASDSIKVNKSKTIRWAWIVARMGIEIQRE